MSDVDAYIKFKGAIGTVADQVSFPITYNIYGDDASNVTKLQYYIGDLTIANGTAVENVTYNLMRTITTIVTGQDVNDTVTGTEIQTALSKSGYPSDGPYILKLVIYDNQDTELANASQVFVWMNNVIKIDLGDVTAYGAAKKGGFEGSYAEFCASMAAFARSGYILDELANYQFVVTGYTDTGMDNNYYGLYNELMNTYTSWTSLVNNGMLVLSPIEPEDE